MKAYPSPAREMLFVEFGALQGKPVQLDIYNALGQRLLQQQFDNAPSGGMAGSITAALFLRRFVTETPRYVHFDIYGWQPTAQPARPKGGAAQGARAILAALPGVLGL